MQKWECPCGYIYDPATGDEDNGVAPGTAWEDVPEDWVCPLCGAEKESFWKAAIFSTCKLCPPKIFQVF